MKLKKTYHIKAVLFDFDGTLTLPGALDFSIIKKKLNCPLDKPVLEFIEGIEDKSKRSLASQALNDFEMDGARKSLPNAETEPIIRFLQSLNLKIGIITRNSSDIITISFKNFDTVKPDDFNVIITRDDPLKPKPSGQGIRHAAEKMGIQPEEILVVGDYIFDIQAGNRAGSVTAFLQHPDSELPDEGECDYIISCLSELKDIVRMGLPLPAGKFPGALLETFLNDLNVEDSSVLIKARMGEDIAALDISGEETLILKSDPITFVSDSIGYYTVLINSNDIATSGATPRWLLTTLLLPPGITPSEVYHILYELSDTCSKWGITLCGGHTEITDAVTRPVVTGMLAGTVARSKLIDKRNMQTGDRILLTKGVAVEGTAIISHEFESRLKESGLQQKEIEDCKQFINQLSILTEAEIAGNHKGVTAMHDVTEGGLATALEELSIAGGYKIRAEINKIPLFSETEKICAALNINPMGLIGSGSLLICCNKETSDNLVKKLTASDIKVTCIGEVIDRGRGVNAFQNENPVKWPVFEVDEITHLY
ncbi:MAG: HAD-IA family hydrolase [Desulfobacterales bacterium]|nr:HAD-IA family hydrolase [Desulfobacterales bacterium]